MSEQRDYFGRPMPPGYKRWVCDWCTAACNFEAMQWCERRHADGPCPFDRDQPESNDGCFAFMAKEVRVHMEHEQRAREVVKIILVGVVEDGKAGISSDLTIRTAESAIITALQQVERDTIERCVKCLEEEVENIAAKKWNVYRNRTFMMRAEGLIAHAVDILKDAMGRERGGYSAEEQQ